jgi:hypothetical protein
VVKVLGTEILPEGPRPQRQLRRGFVLKEPAIGFYQLLSNWIEVIKRVLQVVDWPDFNYDQA